MNGRLPTVRIWYDNLSALAGSERKPLFALAPGNHVHGGLRLEIAGRLVPSLGYWGQNDACFQVWLEELRRAAEALKPSGRRHIFDEGEQGQPAFVFEREGDQGFFTIAASELSDGEANPHWYRVEFSPEDFLAAYQNFRASFTAELRRVSPVAANAWLKRIDSKQDLFE
jgi:hypothetical protein